MSRQAATASGAVGAGKGAVAALIVVGTALALLLIVRARPGPEPFDPRSSSPTGATGLVALLDRSGGEVSITREAPEPGAPTRVLVLVDELDDTQRAATLDFVEAGGVAIVADPTSTLHGGPALDGGSVAIEGGRLPEERVSVELEANVRGRTCNIDALRSIRGVFVADGVLFPVGPNEPQCLAQDGQSFVIVRDIGAGRVVGLGENEVFINRDLRRADNAGLATALLTPVDGSRVTILLGTGTAATVADVGEGDDTLIDLVPTWIWMCLVLGALGFVAFAVARSVRVGEVLDEPLASPIAGSELVAATGNLMQRAKHTGKAGWLLQSQLHRDLCRELHVDVGAPLADVDAAAVSRSPLPPGNVEAVLRQQVADDAQLLALSSQIDRIRKEVLT